jgi:hypothetical protein
VAIEGNVFEILEKSLQPRRLADLEAQIFPKTAKTIPYEGSIRRDAYAINFAELFPYPGARTRLGRIPTIALETIDPFSSAKHVKELLKANPVAPGTSWSALHVYNFLPEDYVMEDALIVGYEAVPQSMIYKTRNGGIGDHLRLKIRSDFHQRVSLEEAFQKTEQEQATRLLKAASQTA